MANSILSYDSTQGPLRADKSASNPGKLGPTNISVEQGETANLNCMVNTKYTPNIKWLRKLETMAELNISSSELINIGSDYYRLLETNSAITRTCICKDR